MRATLRLSSLLVPLLLVTGCMAHRDTLTAAGSPVPIAARDVQNLERVASRHMQCPVAALTSQPVADRVWQVTGCGTSAEFSLVDRGRLRRSRWEPLLPLGSRASNELGCPPESVVVEALGRDKRRVSGCGRAAQYQLACTARSCDWVLTPHDGGYWGGHSSITVQPPTQTYPRQTYPQDTHPQDTYPQPYPPQGHAPQPAPQRQRPSGGPVIVVPDERPGADAAEAAIRAQLDRERQAILACAPEAEAIVLRARWGPDGVVQVTIDPSWTSGRTIEPCVLGSISELRVTTGQPGDMIHVVR